jgi:hypothetical protein
MPLYPDHLSAEEKSARRVINRRKWWRRKGALLGWEPDTDGWLITYARPHAPFYLSVAPQGNKGRLRHRPREQIIATRGTARYTLTVALCGVETWWAVMQPDAARVCVRCECAHLQVGEVIPDVRVKTQ